MTAQNMLNALPIIQRFMDLNLPIDKAYKVFSLTKQINEKSEFFINKENYRLEPVEAFNKLYKSIKNKLAEVGDE